MVVTAQWVAADCVSDESVSAARVHSASQPSACIISITSSPLLSLTSFYRIRDSSTSYLNTSRCKLSWIISTIHGLLCTCTHSDLPKPPNTRQICWANCQISVQYVISIYLPDNECSKKTISNFHQQSRKQFNTQRSTWAALSAETTNDTWWSSDTWWDSSNYYLLKHSRDRQYDTRQILSNNKGVAGSR